MMCRRSPGFLPSTLGTAVTGTVPQQLDVGVDAGAMTIAPLDPQSVRPDQRQRERANIGRHAFGIEDWSPAHLLDTNGTGTRQPKLTGREKSLVASFLPFNEHAIVTAGDSVGDRKSHGKGPRSGERENVRSEGT